MFPSQTLLCFPLLQMRFHFECVYFSTNPLECLHPFKMSTVATLRAKVMSQTYLN